MQDELSEQSPDAIFLAETDVKTAELSFYFGEGERMHLLLNFLLHNHFFLALAREEAEPLRHILQVLPDRPPACHWANFARNHDELNLDRLERAQWTLPHALRESHPGRRAPKPAAAAEGGSLIPATT